MEKWQKDIIKGMKLIAKGCKANIEWKKCTECPFKHPCDTMDENIAITNISGDETVQSWENL